MTPMFLPYNYNDIHVLLNNRKEASLLLRHVLYVYVLLTV